MNAICFRKPQYEEALSFKEDLEKAISEMASSQSLNSLNMDGLRQLKQLLDEGIITQEDFDKKKAQMLGL